MGHHSDQTHSFQRPLLLLGTLVLLALGVHALQHRLALESVAGVHAHDMVLIGDSHGDDLPWPDRPRFTNPAQDLFTAHQYLEAIIKTRPADSKLQTVVLTVWPNKFAPLALQRMSGVPQEDGWDQQALGKLAPLLSIADLLEPLGPARLKWRALFHSLQLKRVGMRFDQNCFEQSVRPDFRRGQGYAFMHTHWWAETEESQEIVERFAQQVVDQGWRLILLENPLHWHYLEQIHAHSHADYRHFLTSLDARHGEAVTFLGLGPSDAPYTFFRDWHHLTCEGEGFVGEQLERALAAEIP